MCSVDYKAFKAESESEKTALGKKVLVTKFFYLMMVVMTFSSKETNFVGKDISTLTCRGEII